jgi:hypothetical protein
MKRDDDMLEQAESLDSDQVRNDDGDQVADPPDEWIGADDNDSLADKLAAEVPDDPGSARVSTDAHDAGSGGALGLVSDDDLDGRSDRARSRQRADRRDARGRRLVFQRRGVTTASSSSRLTPPSDTHHARHGRCVRPSNQSRRLVQVLQQLMGR